MTELTGTQRTDSRTLVVLAVARAAATMGIWAGVAWTGNVIISLMGVVATLIVWASASRKWMGT
jgi:hypothetical protein